MNKENSPEISITREWNRPDPLAVENRKQDKAYRWVDKEKIEQRQYEGWSPVRDDEVIHRNPDGNSYGQNKEYRELILCEMPVERAEARNRFYREKARRAAEVAQIRFHQEARRLGVSTDV